MKRHQQEQQQQHASHGSGRASAQAPSSSAEPPLQFDSNMDWPASNEARDPLPFPTAHIAPCARITTRIYHPPPLTQPPGPISGLGAGGAYAQQRGRVETVRDVLVEIAGPSRDEMGRPIIPLPPPPIQHAQQAQSSQPVQQQQQQQQQQQAVAQRIGGRTTINNGTGAGTSAAVIDADDGAGFTGAGGFLLGGMANAVSVTGHNSGGNAMAGANMGGGGAVDAAGGGGGGGGGNMDDDDVDDDDSMSSGWSTSDSEMSYDANAGRGNAMAGGGPTRPNPAFGGGAASTGNAAGHHHHHHPQEYQPPQRAYLLQRTLREAIYGRVRYGIVLKRRQLPPDYDATSSSQPMAEWEVTNERCAVKEMSWQHIRKERNRLAEDPIKEVSAMQYLKRYLAQCHGSAASLDSSDAMLSTHIMLPLDLLSDDRYLYSVMPYCDGGELFDRLDQRQKFSEDEARYWMRQILDGVDSLQRAGICHRDMSLENLLVHKERICLVIDMGMCLRIPYEGAKEDASDLFDHAIDDDTDGHDDSKRPRALSTGADLRKSFMSMDLDNGAGGIAGGADAAEANGAVDTGNEKTCCLDIRQRKRHLMKPQGTCGKWHYMTSEIMKNRDPFDGHAVDMWAVGVILFLMLTGFPPWERACRTDERFKYMSAGYLVQMLTEWDLGLSPDAMDLLQRMVWIDPRDRLSLRQVRNHPWMLA